MNFADWQEALPLGLSVGRRFARRCPLPIDVESVVMEALWRAHAHGVHMTKAYVVIRVKGAMRDEARRVAEGERGNYQSVRAFVGDDALIELSGEHFDPCSAIDDRALLDSLPDAARGLVIRIANGERLDEIAASLRVSPGRISQVVAKLKARPHAVARLPGKMDFFAELRAAHRRMLGDVYGQTGSVTGVARSLGVSVSDASRWLSQKKLIVPRYYWKFQPLRERARVLAEQAFRRANGSPMTAARLLGTDQHSARDIGDRFCPDLVRTNRRPDLKVDAIIELRKKGLSTARIADHFDVGESTVLRRIKRAHGAVPKDLRKVRPDLPDVAFLDLHREGLKWREIADRLGVSMATVRNRLARAKAAGLKPLAKCGPLAAAQPR